MQKETGAVMVYMPKQQAEAQEQSDEIRQLYDIVLQCGKDGYHDRIIEAADWDIMYQLAESRTNLIEWLNITPDMKVLEIGAGCGTLTGALLQKGAYVAAQETNIDFCQISALRHKSSGRLEIFAQPFSECEPILSNDFDLALVVDAQVDMTAGDFLKRLLKHLKKNGLLVLAVENKFGLKYWAGCAEEHSGVIFGGLEHAPEADGIPACTKSGLQRLLHESGFKNVQFYYPYPDYRFPLNIYSDGYLPKKGELSYNITNYDSDRLVLFDEQKVFDTIIDEGQFPQFSNSFLCFAKKQETAREMLSGDILYTRYASDRAREFAVRTDIIKGSMDGSVVRKHALYEEGIPHIRHIASAYEKLTEQYESSGLLFNRCQLKEESGIYAEFEYIRGESLLNEVEQAVAEQKYERVYEILTRMIQYIRSDKNSVPFQMTDAFVKVFGSMARDALPGTVLCSKISDIDLILPNIFVDRQGAWNVIDYEWTFFFPLPQDFIIYRTLFFLAQENAGNEALSMEKLLPFAGISQEEALVYKLMEERFQNYVTGEAVPYREMVNVMGRKFFNVMELKADYDRVAAQNELLKSKGFWKLARKLKHMIFKS